MAEPHVGEPFEAAPGTQVIPTYWPVPGMGTITMNSFLVQATEPVLVDSGTAVLDDAYLDALSSLIDPARLQWIWLTHEDRDHTGSLLRLLDLAPAATVVGTFMTFGRLAPEVSLPFDRQLILNHGDVLNVGDRNLRAIRPPLFDSPGTLGFLDDQSGALVSSDCFGAPLDGDQSLLDHVDDVHPEDLRAAQVAWATVDSPWVSLADEAALRSEVEAVRRLAPSMLLSSHLPPAHNDLEHSFDSLLAARVAEPLPGLTQRELEALLAEFAPVGASQDSAPPPG